MARKQRKYIKIRGASEHNLKAINIDIPRDEFVVLTGLSGSGKSSTVAVTFGEEKVTDVKAGFDRETFAGEGVVVKRGKKNFRRIVLR